MSFFDLSVFSGVIHKLDGRKMLQRSGLLRKYIVSDQQQLVALNALKELVDRKENPRRECLFPPHQQSQLCSFKLKLPYNITFTLIYFSHFTVFRCVILNLAVVLVCAVLLRWFFDLLLDEDIIQDAVFLKWKSSTDTDTLAAVNKFFALLQKA